MQSVNSESTEFEVVSEDSDTLTQNLDGLSFINISKARVLVNQLLKNDIHFMKLLLIVQKFDDVEFENLFSGIHTTYSKISEREKRLFEFLLAKFDNFNSLLKIWHEEEDKYNLLENLWKIYPNFKNLSKLKTKERIIDKLAAFEPSVKLLDSDKQDQLWQSVIDKRNNKKLGFYARMVDSIEKIPERIKKLIKELTSFMFDEKGQINYQIFANVAQSLKNQLPFFITFADIALHAIPKVRKLLTTSTTKASEMLFACLGKIKRTTVKMFKNSKAILPGLALLQGATTLFFAIKDCQDALDEFKPLYSAYKDELDAIKNVLNGLTSVKIPENDSDLDELNNKIKDVENVLKRLVNLRIEVMNQIKIQEAKKAGSTTSLIFSALGVVTDVAATVATAGAGTLVTLAYGASAALNLAATGTEIYCLINFKSNIKKLKDMELDIIDCMKTAKKNLEDLQNMCNSYKGYKGALPKTINK